MQVEVEQAGSAWVIKVRGEVDVFTAPTLDQALEERLLDSATVVVDLSAVDFLDSTGLGVLVKGLKRARSLDAALRVVVTSRRVARPFELTGLDASIPIYDTLEGALAL